LTEYQEEWKKQNPHYQQEYYNKEENKARHKKVKAVWRKRNREYLRQYEAEKMKSDVHFLLASKLRKRLYQAIRGTYKTGSAIKDLGCSIPELKQYFEALFQPGMAWDNYGEWHIDHIKPLSSFDLTDMYQLRQACHYANLQPLWAIDNLKKGSKVV
jgi:hypothetical protein